MGVTKLVKKLIHLPKRPKESAATTTTTTSTTKAPTKKTKYGFGPLRIKLSNDVTSAALSSLTKSLQWTIHNHCVVITIAESKRKHEDHRVYAELLARHGPTEATEKERTLFYWALGEFPWTDLVVQAGNPSSKDLYAMVRLRDLNVALLGGAVESLTLRGLVIVATQEHVNEFANTLRGLKNLCSVILDQCSLVIVDKFKKGTRVEGWDPMLRAISSLPAMEVLQLTHNTDIQVCPLVLSTLQSEAESRHHRIIQDTLSQDYLESLLLQDRNRLERLKELRLSFVWNDTNETSITSFVRSHPNIESLHLTLQDQKDSPCFSSFLQALTTNRGLHKVHLQALTSAKPLLDRVDSEVWKRLREQNKTLQELDIDPELLDPLVHALNDVWLEMNQRGCFLPHRLDENDALLWTRVFAHRRVSEDPTLLYTQLMKVHSSLIPLRLH